MLVTTVYSGQVRGLAAAVRGGPGIGVFAGALAERSSKCVVITPRDEEGKGGSSRGCTYRCLGNNSHEIHRFASDILRSM